MHIRIPARLQHGLRDRRQESSGAQLITDQRHGRHKHAKALKRCLDREIEVLKNLLGNDVEKWREPLNDPLVKLHLYGKTEIQPGRKMGHLTALANDVATARKHVEQARAALTARQHKST